MDQQYKLISFIKGNSSLIPNAKLVILHFSDFQYGEIHNNKFPCYITINNNDLYIYNNSIFYLVPNYKDHKEEFVKIISKQKIIVFHDAIKKELLTINLNFNVTCESELYSDQSYVSLIENFGNIFKSYQCKYIVQLITNLIIKENTFSKRSFSISRFQNFKDILIKKNFIEINQIYNDPFYIKKICYHAQSQRLFIIKDSTIFNHIYHKNEKKFILALNKFRAKLFNEFRFKENIEYDSNFPIVNSFVSSKENNILCEFLMDKTLYDRYSSKNIKPNLIEKYIYIINIIRSINLVHSLGFLYRDIKPNNFVFKDSKSNVPILFNISSVMGMKIANKNKSIFRTNIKETADMGSYLYFSPEKVVSSNISFPSDIYPLGTMLYYILTGELPFNASLAQILNIIKESNFLSLETKLKELRSKSENYDFNNLLDKDIHEIDLLYKNCIAVEPSQRMTIREFGINIIEFIQRILKRNYNNNDLFDQNNLKTLQNCLLGLINDLSSPIPFVKGLSDSYYAYSSTNGLENFHFFLIDHEILFDTSLFYISQIKLNNFCTFHFDELNDKIQNLILCVEEYAIIVKNFDNLIKKFINNFYSSLKQLKLIPSSKYDEIKLRKFFLNNNQNELKIIEWDLIENLTEQIETVIIPRIVRKEEDIVEPKTHSLVPLILNLIINNYSYHPNPRNQIQNLDNLIEIKIDNTNLLLDLESFSVIIQEKPERIQEIENWKHFPATLQEIISFHSNYLYYCYYPYKNDKNKEKITNMTKQNKIKLAYMISYALDNLQKNNLLLNSLDFSDLFISEKGDNFDIKIRLHNNLSINQKYKSNWGIFKKFIQKIDLTELNELIKKFEYDKNVNLNFINYYIYVKYIDQIGSSIQINLTHLSKLSTDSLPFAFNGNDLFPKDYLQDYSNNIFNFNFYNLSSVDPKTIISHIQFIPFITYEYIDKKYFIACIENKAFFIENYSNDFGQARIKNFFGLCFQKNQNLTLIPIKRSDKEEELFKSTNNFFNKIDQIIIEKNIEKIKQKVLQLLKEQNQYTNYFNYSNHINDLLTFLSSILSPVIAYLIFRHYFQTSCFEDKSFFDFPYQNDNNLIDFTRKREDLIDFAQIGNGSAAYVYLVIHLPSLYPLALKEYKFNMFEYFYIEKKVGEDIMKHYSHILNKKNNLAKFYGYIDKKDQKSIIMQFCTNGSLENVPLKELFTDDHIKKLYDSINIYGIGVLHELHYIHRDIKPANILLNNDFDPIIIDFNGAISFEEKDRCKNHISKVGSYLYSSPELLKGEYYDSNTDLYSLKKVFNFDE